MITNTYLGKSLFTFLTYFSLSINCFSQISGEDIGAGVIDFLLQNPKTANKLNPTEEAALSVIGDLFQTAGQRKHEIRYAESGQDEIVINYDQNNQATILKDLNGNVYILIDGTFYPIAQTLVNQAQNECNKPTSNYVHSDIKNSTLSPYDLTALSKEFDFNKKETRQTIEWYRYYMTDNKELINDISIKHNISKENIFFNPYSETKKGIQYFPNSYNIKSLINISGLSTKTKQYLTSIYNSQNPIIKTAYGCEDFTNGRVSFFNAKKVVTFAFPVDGFAILFNNYIERNYSYDFRIVTTFTCNWAKDFDGHGWDLNDFQGIKRSFHQEENILFVVGYTSEVDGQWEFEIYEASNGNEIYRSTGFAERGAKIVQIMKEANALPLGVYTYNFSFSMSDSKKISKNEIFEIVNK